ncbi:MAG: hypothetical protein ACLQJL_01775 [Roseiarcus sp.]
MNRLAGWSLIVSTCAAVCATSAPALAQGAPSVNYTSFDATSAKPVQIGYYGSAHKDCTPAPLPNIRVVEPPKSGTLTFRRGVLTTSNVAGCPGLRIPAQVAFYRARAGATGTDHIVYLVTNTDGAAGAYDVTINIKEAPNSPAPNPGNPI